MSDELSMGPIDYLVVEWPKGSPPTGEAFPHLVDLVDRGLIRILDMSFVQKAEDGTVTEVEIGDFDLDGNPDIAVFQGVRSDLISDEEQSEAAEALEPGTAGAILIYENLWAAPFATALRNAGAQLVAAGRIPVNAIIQALDELEADDELAAVEE